MSSQHSNLIFDSGLTFDQKALQVFEHQSEQNGVYSKFCKALGIHTVQGVDEIPLLPIQAFKDAKIVAGRNAVPDFYFQSSGTSGIQRSKHFVTDLEMYRTSIISGMDHFYDLDDYIILAYTPGYSTNPHSSLIWMLKVLIERDSSGLSTFLEIGEPLNQSHIDEITSTNNKIMLFGAAFGLLDLIDSCETKLPDNIIVMETGGMKTHRRELSKTELHQKLTEGFNLSKENIHSEYGMTELLSQAYSRGSEWFECVPWMKVSIRNPKNPFEAVPHGEEGLIGVIDLANMNSCSFILTGDKGIQNEQAMFKVLGRWNPQNLRGCNFLIDQD